MYMIRTDANIKLNQVQASKVIGLTQPTLSNILTGKVACKKSTAYCITKYLNVNAEIEDYFTRKEK